METRDLYPFILLIISVGMLIGVGILVFDNFGTASSMLYTVNDSFTFPQVGVNATLDHGNITSFTEILNSSGSAQPTTNYTTYLSNPNIAARVLNTENSSCAGGDTCYAFYTYRDYATNTRSAMNSMVTSTSSIATTWLALIITVAVLAIVLGLVIRSFGRGR